MKKAHITFQGGLGNQMFQYLFYNYIKSIGFVVYADDSLYSRTKMHSGFILDKVFNIDLLFSEKDIILSNNKFVKKFLSLGLGDKRVVTEENFDADILKKHSDIRLVGYWQTSGFVKDMYSKINDLFIFNTNLSVEAKSVLESIENTRSVAIHIRKGDYVDKKNKDLFGLCSSNYYSKAIEQLNIKAVGKKEFYVFSDDINYSKKLLGDNLDCTFIELNNEIEELFLMHRCKHQIIANSTFSWWGATLNTNINKVVIYPNPWYDKITEHVFIPTEWMKINKY